MVTWSIWNIRYKDNTVIFLEISAENSTEKISLVTSNVSRKNFNFYSSKISCLKKADTEPTFGWNHQAMHSWYCTNKDQKKKKKNKERWKERKLMALIWKQYISHIYYEKTKYINQQKDTARANNTLPMLVRHSTS